MKSLALLAVVLLQAAGGNGTPPRAPAPLSDTGTAVGVLLAASATPIARGSSCDAEIRGKPRRTLGDVMADKLAGFAEGSNQIAGGCAGGQCRVVLTHRGGEEDLFQYEYRFRVARGRLVPASLSCFGS
ncbi:hypothetical protein [Sphingomonas sp.]|uniref:hypothetical protein n=1 Tax=Sphingomonas sp. TaxID=28214 RepID=UPI003AFF941B